MTTGTRVEDIDLLHERAVRATGLDDFGGTAYRVALGVLLDSYAEDAQLNPAGAAQFSNVLVSVLVARLRTQRARTLHPEYAENRVARPLFVTGLPRTGTTILHRLLCAVPGSQGLEHWLADAPQPRPPRSEWEHNADFRRTQEQLDAVYQDRPGFEGVHYMSAGSVEECWRLKRQSMESIAFASTAYLPGYVKWLLQQPDRRSAYEVHRDALALIGLGSGDRWVLKSPDHLFDLDALLAVYPDALIVQTHRDPRTSMASLCSLNVKATAGASQAWTAELVGQDALAIWSEGVRRFTDDRRRLDTGQFVDVRYADLIEDPAAVVASIHDRFGLAWDEHAREAVRARHEESSKGVARPNHSYALEDFGLSRRRVEDEFAPYLAEYFS